MGLSVKRIGGNLIIGGGIIIEPTLIFLVEYNPYQSQY